MCSLTWLRLEDGYELFFNRDESRTRLPARPPSIVRRGGVQVIAPVDADAGGTWLGVNDRGLTVALLNGDAGGTAPPASVSRGLLVFDVLDAPDSAEVERRLRALDLSRRRPFRMVALEPGALLFSGTWDGEALRTARLADDAQPISSSSLDPLGAGRNRRAVLEGMLAEAPGPSTELLLAFHASHAPHESAVSACMHREDAETVSFTRTRVGAGTVELGYSPAPPCRGVALTWLEVERRAPPPGSRVGRAPAPSARA